MRSRMTAPEKGANSTYVAPQVNVDDGGRSQAAPPPKTSIFVGALVLPVVVPAAVVPATTALRLRGAAILFGLGPALAPSLVERLARSEGSPEAAAAAASRGRKPAAATAAVAATTAAVATPAAGVAATAATRVAARATGRALALGMREVHDEATTA